MNRRLAPLTIALAALASCASTHDPDEAVTAPDELEAGVDDPEAFPRDLLSADRRRPGSVLLARFAPSVRVSADGLPEGVQVRDLDLKGAPTSDPMWLGLSLRGRAGAPALEVVYRDAEGRVLGRAAVPCAFPTPGETWVRCRAAGPALPALVTSVTVEVADEPSASSEAPAVELLSSDLVREPADLPIVLSGPALAPRGGGWRLTVSASTRGDAAAYACVAAQFLDRAGRMIYGADLWAHLPSKGEVPLELVVPELSVPLWKVRVIPVDYRWARDHEPPAGSPVVRAKRWPPAPSLGPSPPFASPWRWGPVMVEVAADVPPGAVTRVSVDRVAWEEGTLSGNGSKRPGAWGFWSLSLRVAALETQGSPRPKLGVEFFDPSGALIGLAEGPEIPAPATPGSDGGLVWIGFSCRAPKSPAEVGTVRIRLLAGDEFQSKEGSSPGWLPAKR